MACYTTHAIHTAGSTSRASCSRADLQQGWPQSPACLLHIRRQLPAGGLLGVLHQQALLLWRVVDGIEQLLPPAEGGVTCVTTSPTSPDWQRSRACEASKAVENLLKGWRAQTDITLP